MRFVYCIILVFLVEIASVMGANTEYLGNLAFALQSKNSDLKLDMLHKAIVADPDNCQVACQEAMRILNKIGLKSEKSAPFLKLWDLYPASQPIAEIGVLLSLSQVKDLAPTSDKLNNTIILLSKKLKEGDNSLLCLVAVAQAMNLRTQKYDSCKKLFEAVYPLFDGVNQFNHLIKTLKCYSVIVMRTELVSIKSSSFKQLPPSSWIDEYNKILTMLSEREENFSGEELMDLVVTYQRLGIKRALTICKKRGLYSLSSSWIDLWVEIATSMGTMSELNEAMKYKVESVEAQRVRRFYNHLHRKDFAAAKVELDSITVPALKSKLSIILYVTQQDCVQLQKITKELISRGLGSENLVMPLLIIAERTGDKKALAQAFALAKKLDDANDANSFGYVSTVLEVNMKRAYQLINKAVKAEPENGAYLDSMAYWHYKMKNYSEAQKWMNKALDNIQIHYEIGTMLYHAGEIALALNQVECAKKYFLLALKNKDDDSSLDVKKVEQALEALKNK